MTNLRLHRLFWRLLFITMVFTLSGTTFSALRPHDSVLAQNLRPEEVADLVYQKIPDLPKENNYQRREGGEALNHTLISRFIRYHQFVKSRPTNFRLDWKLTFADFLGVNETIREERYPGYATLIENPFSQDFEIITSLSRQQREELIDVLINIYQPQITPNVTDSVSPATISPTIIPRGGADLLR